MLLSFHEWRAEHEVSDGPTIYLDLDGTLIDCVPEDTARRDELPNGIKVERHFVFARPHAEEFIRACQKLCPTYILSHAKTHRQRLTIERLGWEIEVFGQDDHQNLPQSRSGILVDDRPPEHPFTTNKMKAIGISADRVITLPAWEVWDGEHDDVLPKVFQQVKSMISTHESLHEWTEKIKPTVAKQPFKCYDKALELAKDRERHFEKLLKKSAGKGNEVLMNIKTEKSFIDKTKKRGKDPKEVKDVLRAAILCKDKLGMYQALEKVKKNFKVVNKIEHKDDPTENKFGYYGAIHVDVVLDKMICEIQIMTKKFWKYKEKAHVFYVKHRAKKRPPKKDVERCRELYKKGNEGK